MAIAIEAECAQVNLLGIEEYVNQYYMRSS